MTLSPLRPLTTLATAALAVLVFSGCVAEARGAASAPPTAAVDVADRGAPPLPAAESAPPTIAGPIDVDAAGFTSEVVAGYVFSAGDADCQIQPGGSGTEPSFGCAIGAGQQWTWADTEFADECAARTEFGCRNGLVVRGSASPEPRLNTDADFGGYHPDVELASTERIVVNSVSCERDGAGVRCGNSESGHGFTLSATSIEAW